MANRTFNIPKSKGKSFKTIDAIDVAAKYFVYKLYEATDGRPMQWQLLLGLGSPRRPFPGLLRADGSFSRTSGASLWTIRLR